MKTYDIAIIGGGIMGLMSAYFASKNGYSIVILEKSTIGNKQAASFSYTRSMRTDYLDPFYAGLANESRKLWLDIEREYGESLLVKCGCLNLVAKSVSLDINNTYGARSYEVISALGYNPVKFSGSELNKKFPQFAADAGYLDTLGGYFDLTRTTNLLLQILAECNVRILENIEIKNIAEITNKVEIKANNITIKAKKVIIVAGMGTNEVLGKVWGNELRMPLSFDKPKECKYYYPKLDDVDKFLPVNFPVFAYLDVGIYGHPIYDQAKNAVKISYYNPPDLETKINSAVKSISDFVNRCLPLLKDVKSENVKDADQCSYDLVSDDNFIIGKLPGYKNITIGCGWRGTGYKFAPFIGKVLSGIDMRNQTNYDITKFNPERFIR